MAAKILLAVLMLAVVAGLLVADFQWRRWIAGRGRERREEPGHRFP